MYNVKVDSKELNGFITFTEAFKSFFQEVKTLVSGGAALQILETWCWIEIEYGSPEKGKAMMNFYQARDFAYAIGLLREEGELQENTIEPLPELVEMAFSLAFAENQAVDYEDVLEMISSKRLKEILDEAGMGNEPEIIVALAEMEKDENKLKETLREPSEVFNKMLEMLKLSLPLTSIES